MSRMLFAAIIAILYITGCADNDPSQFSHHMVVDLYHGAIDPVVAKAVGESGFILQKNDGPITKQSLAKVGTLWIAETATRGYEPKEVSAIERFVKRGGTLLCADQAWSWAYAKKDVADYPLNQIGKRLGFTITGQNIGSPVNKETSEYVDGIEQITRTDWWPSKIEATAPEFQPLIRDEKLNTISMYIPYGKGRIFVFGHSALLRDNPAIVLNILRTR